MSKRRILTRIVQSHRAQFECLEQRHLLAGDAQAGIGLLAQTYLDPGFESFHSAQVDTPSNHSVPANIPVANVVRWSGEVEATRTELHQFWVNADGGVRLWVNGQLLIDRFNDANVVDSVGTIDLIAGRRYDIQLEYRVTGTDGIDLEWQAPSLARQIIPAVKLFPSERGSLTEEIWLNIPGANIADLTNSSAFALPSPVVSSLENFTTQSNIGDDFGRRISGYISPSVTGDYVFYLQADEHAELWLSSTSDASFKQRVAFTTAATGSTQWISPASVPSQSIRLLAGHSYYIEALHKEQLGADYLSVGWLKPGASTIEVIPADVLSPTVPTVRMTAITPSAAEGSGQATFELSRSGGTFAQPLTVYYNLRGTATNGIDASNLPGSVVIPAGQVSTIVAVEPLLDSLNEGVEFFELELQEGAGYRVGLISERTAIATIQDVRSAPAGGTVLLASSALSNFVRYGASYSTVTDNDPDTNFGQVIQAVIATPHANIWDAQMIARNPTPINSGDLLFAQFHVRSLNGVGRFSFVSELGQSPYTKNVIQSIDVGAHWSLIQIPFVAVQDFAANALNYSFQLGDRVQTLQFANLQWKNYGPSSDMMPASGMFLNNIGGAWGTMFQTPISNQAFANAQQVETITTPPNGDNWRLQSVARNATPVNLGQVMQIEFWARSLSGSSPQMSFAMQRTDNFATLNFANVGITNEWQKFTYNVPSNGNYAANGLQIVFNLGFAPQVVQFAAVEWRNTSGTGSIADLPSLIPAVTYGGRGANESWRDDAQERIDDFRMANVQVQVIDEYGQPVNGAVVSLRQDNHAFKFGSAISAMGGLLDPNTTNPAALQYQALIKRLFNAVVIENSLKWPTYLQDPQRGIDAANWAVENDLYLRGHNIIWPSRTFMPTSVWNQYDTILNTQGQTAAAEYLRTTINARIVDAVTTFEGLAGEWDVVNEPYANHDAMDVLGNNVLIDWFQLVETLSPTTEKVLNDYDIFVRNGANTAHRANFESWLTQLNTLGLLDRIGEQSHYTDGSLTDMVALGSLIEQYHNQFGVPIAITEFDLNSKDQQLQADYLRDYLTMSFSQEGIDQFLNWGFWSQAHWLPDAAFYNADFSIRPNGQVWEDLVYGSWWTDKTGTTFSGTTQFSATLGSYIVEVEYNGMRLKVPVNSLAGDATVLVQLPGVSVNPIELSVVEGSQASYVVRLATQPSDIVTLSIMYDNSQVSLSSDLLVFTPDDWHVEQTVNVNAKRDYIVEAGMTTSITHISNSNDERYNGYSIQPVTIAITDGSLPGLTIDSNSIAENLSTGALIGSLTPSNAIESAFFTYTLVEGLGSDDNALFSIEGDHVLAGQSFDFETKPSSSIRVQVTDDQSRTFESVIDIQILNAPELIGEVRVNDGQQQRSRVEKLSLEFDSPIDFSSNAFIIEKRVKDNSNSLILQSVPIQVNVIPGANAGTSIEITFLSSVRNGTAALADGNYMLTINGSAIVDATSQVVFDGDFNSATAGGVYQFGEVEADAFYSLYGDTSMDRLVGMSEFGGFRQAYGKNVNAVGYNPVFDFDSSGVGISDFGQFRQRFGKPKFAFF